jgi:uncharacterized protein YhhL (DUF1145 family)
MVRTLSCDSEKKPQLGDGLLFSLLLHHLRLLVNLFTPYVGKICHPVRLNLSVLLISHGIIFFFRNKTTSAGLSVAETISQTSMKLH